MKDATKMLAVLFMMVAVLFVGAGLTRISVVQADDEDMTAPTNTEEPTTVPDNSEMGTTGGDLQQ